MRSAIMAVAAALSLITMTNAGSAAPVIPALNVKQDTVIVQVAGGCGRGLHPDRWGRCVPNQYGYYRAYSVNRSFLGGGGEPRRVLPDAAIGSPSD